MTLQERMVAVYLRQAKLPPEEKDKLRLFLGLLLTTLEEEEDWEKDVRSDNPSDRLTPATSLYTREALDPAEQSRAEQSRAEQSTRAGDAGYCL